MPNSCPARANNNITQINSNNYKITINRCVTFKEGGDGFGFNFGGYLGIWRGDLKGRKTNATNTSPKRASATSRIAYELAFTH